MIWQKTIQIPMQGTQHMQGVHRQDEARRLNVLYLYRCQRAES